MRLAAGPQSTAAPVHVLKPLITNTFAMKQLTVKDVCFVLSEPDEEKSWVSLELEGIFGCPHVCGHKADEKKEKINGAVL